MRPASLIVIHCSATKNGASLFQGEYGQPGFKTPAQVIDGWHADRGFARRPEFMARQNPSLAAIGYHFVIGTSGVVFTGRHLDEVPAHATGWNKPAIAVCMVGTDQFSADQWRTLTANVQGLAKAHDIPLEPPRLGNTQGVVLSPGVCGHRDLSPDRDGNGRVERHEWLKTCPGFNVADWLAGGLQPLAGHVLGAKP